MRLKKVNAKETKEREEGVRPDNEEVNRRDSIDNSQKKTKFRRKCWPEMDKKIIWRRKEMMNEQCGKRKEEGNKDENKL